MIPSRVTFLLLIPTAMAVVFLGLDDASSRSHLTQVHAAEPPAPKTPAGYHTLALNGHNFTLPDGFTIELAAGPTLAERPVSGSFDEKGRLYVTDSSGDNSKAPEQAKTKTHHIRRLEDTNGDGVFDKSTLFVKNVSMPQGALFYKGSLYIAAPPQIVKFTDTNDDGIADKEEVWFDGKTVGGCGNDVHGPWIGPDGWFYWTKGGFEKQEYTLPNGKKWSTRAAHVFRAKPDGTSLEPIMTGGMDNPVGLTFTHTGEVLVCGTFFQNPADGKRDGIIHAVYGGVFGKDHSPIYEHPWTSPHLMPIMTHLGPAAACALTSYRSDQFGKEYVDNVFCCQFNLRTVSRHVLEADGSTYRTIDTNFVTSDNLDFHPTDVIEDTDGSLLIIDTGGWYKLCCPTSQLVKTDVTGAIYRVRKVGAHAKRVERKQSEILLLHRIVEDSSLKSQDLHIVRDAVEWLGRARRQDGISKILEVMDRSSDRFLDHTCVYALMEIGDPSKLARSLDHPSTRVRRAVMTALDQMPDGKLDSKYVLAELDSPDSALRDTAWWIAGRHPEWGEQLAAYFKERLKSIDKLTAPEQDALVAHIVPLLKSANVRQVTGDALHGTVAISSQLAILRGFAKSGLKSLPSEWLAGIQHTLLAHNEDVLRAAVGVLRTVPPTAVDHAALVAKVGQHRRAINSVLPKDIEYSLRATAPAGAPISNEEAEGLIAAIHRDQPGNVRAAAAEWLARAAVPAASLTALTNAFKTTTPIEFAKLLPAFSSTKEPEAGLAFVRALTDPVVRKLVRVEQVKPILDKYPKPVRDEAEKLYALLTEDRKAERTKLDALIAAAPKGDERRGQVVFNSAKAACIACHKIGYVGGNVGPDLRRIGAVRTERDLMEAIVFPSASFVRSYEPFRVVTASGKAYNGILRKDAPDEVILAVAADQEVRIPRADIEEMTPSTVSVMPAGLDQQLSPQDLADLVAFLKANIR